MKLSVSYLKPGMILKSPVYNNRGELLLNAGCVLTEKYINALKRVGVLAVHIRGAGDLDIEEANNALSNEVKIEALVCVQNFIEQNMTKKNYKLLVSSVKNIVDEILSGKVPVGGLAEISAYDSYTYTHSVDVCALSIAIGYQMDFSRDTLIGLGTGSLLHDLGKTRVPIKILNKPGKLTDEEFAEIKKHPTIGYEMLCYGFDEVVEPETSRILLNHHERYDGNGYPRGLKGNELFDLDMICGVSDMYNAMTTDRVYRKALPYSEAYEMLLGSIGTYFSMEVVQAFARAVEPYPIGTLVEMSDGRRACVVDNNPAMPTRPVIRILGTKEIIDLSKSLTLVIKSQLSQEEISELVMPSSIQRRQA
ncbi:MAG: HD-GYP domain-containing protein [Atribacterales bacterium]